MQIHDLDALALADEIRHRRLSVHEVVHHTLTRIEEHADAVGAFAHLTAEYALRQAADLDQRIATTAEADLPALVGVPCPVKDLTMVKGLPFEAGSAALAGNLACADDGVVELLRDAGTIMVGKTSTPEFGLPAYTEPDTGPPARTPWDLTRSAGGSSGGAAAAVSAGLVPIAHGSDGGGSLRIPASACGLVGLKVTRGRISPGPLGVDGPGLAVQGSLTRTVRDTAAVLDVLAHHRQGDWFTAADPSQSYLAACDHDPGVLTVGVLTDPVIAADAPVHEQARQGAHRAADLLARLGHQVLEAPIPFPAERWEAFSDLWSVMALGAPVSPDREHLLRPLTRWLRANGRDVPGAAYAAALAGIQHLTREVAAAWDRFDIIVTPTLAQPPALVGALRHDDDPAQDFAAQTAYTPWTSIYNLTGRPAISLPLHRARIDGVELPFGVMMGGRPQAEDLLLAVSADLEIADPWPTTPRM